MRFLSVPTTTGARNHGETAVKSQDHRDGPGLSFPAIGFMIFSRAGWRRGASAGSGRFGEHPVQYAAELLWEGHESAVITGEVDYGRAELAGECHGRTVGKLPFRGGPAGDHDARRRRRSASMSGR
jgi:hypothetical protein